MFSKLLGKKKGEESSQDSKLVEKIAKMDLIEMRTFVNGKLTEFEVNEFGLHEIIKKLVSKNTDTQKYYINTDDMDSKKKKAFDLLILILGHKKVSVLVVEYAQKFLEVYEEMIEKYDKDNKQIYDKKIKDVLNSAVAMIDLKADIDEKIRVTQ